MREEETERMKQAREWREAHETLDAIPVEQLRQNGFSRIRISEGRFALYAQLRQGFFKIDSQEYKELQDS